MNQSYSVAVESDEVVVRLRRDAFDNDTISQFLDYLELEAIRKRSQLTQEQAEALADEADRDAWRHLKDTFLGS